MDAITTDSLIGSRARSWENPCTSSSLVPGIALTVIALAILVFALGTIVVPILMLGKAVTPRLTWLRLFFGARNFLKVASFAESLSALEASIVFLSCM